jgi:lipoate-protein ligase A
MSSFDFDGGSLLDDYLRENQDSIRSQMEEITRQRVADVIGQENMSKVTLSFSGTDSENLKMHVDGPDEFKNKIEEALRSGTL